MSVPERTTPPAEERPAVAPAALSDAQSLVESAVRAYSDLAANASPAPAPLRSNHDLTQTDVLRLVSALLEVADVEVFELAMWQLWTPK